MRYEQTKKLSNREFKRLVGVQRRTFDEMVKVLRDAASLKQTRGCPQKVAWEDQVLKYVFTPIQKAWKIAVIKEFLSYMPTVACLTKNPEVVN